MYADQFSTTKVTPELIEAPQAAQVTQEFQTEAYNLRHEATNFRLGDVTREGVLTQLEWFLREYVSRQKEFVFYYSFNQEGLLQSPNWNTPAEEMYRRAQYEEGISDFERNIRYAELESFQQIQALMKHNLASVALDETQFPLPNAILQSPAELHDSPYSFVSIAEVVPDEQGNLQIRMTNRKIFHADIQDHIKARRIWAKDFHTEELNELFTSTGAKNGMEIMGSALFLPAGISFDDLMESYESSAGNPEQIKTEMQITSFMPEIEAFFEKFAQASEKIDDESVYLKLLENFKIFLVKAKVHLNEEDAIRQWGLPTVRKIQRYINPPNQTHNNVQTNERELLALQIQIAGSCGGVGDQKIITSLANTSLNQLIDVIRYRYSVPGRSSSHQTEFTPDEASCNCGCVWYVKNGNTSTYESTCPGCSKTIGECGATMASTPVIGKPIKTKVSQKLQQAA